MFYAFLNTIFFYSFNINKNSLKYIRPTQVLLPPPKLNDWISSKNFIGTQERIFLSKKIGYLRTDRIQIVNFATVRNSVPCQVAGNIAFFYSWEGSLQSYCEAPLYHFFSCVLKSFFFLNLLLSALLLWELLLTISL